MIRPVCIKRLISTSPKLLNRHPVLPEASKLSPDFVSPEFAINQAALQSIQPYVDLKHVKRATKLRLRAKQHAEKASRVAELQEKVDRFLVKAPSSSAKDIISTTSSEPPQPPPPHPDPETRYRQQIEYYRRKFAFEIQQQMEKEAVAMSQKSAREMAKESVSADDSASEQEGTDTGFSSDKEMALKEREALKAIHGLVWKQVKAEKFAALSEQHKSRARQSLASIYHAADSFITPETLEQTIDSCLGRVVQHQLLDSKQMAELLREQTKLTREMELYDALNGTLRGKQSAESLAAEHTRRKEPVAASSI